MHILIIDVNAIGYASMYAPHLSSFSSNGLSTSAIHGAPSSILSVLKRHPDAVPIVLWDGKAQWRLDIHPDYKSNRYDDAEKRALKKDYKRQVEQIKLILSEMGLPQITCPISEADDLAGHLCRHIPKDVEITLYTHDTDWLQLVDDNVTWENSRKKERITLERFNDLVRDGPFDDPAEHLVAKVISGDKSDGIPGIKGLGLKTARGLLQKYGGLEGIYKAVEEGAKVGLREKRIFEGKEVIEKNFKIMDLENSIPVSHHSTVLAMKIEDSDIYDRFELNVLKEKRAELSFDERPIKEALSIVDRALMLSMYPSEDISLEL